MKKKYKNKLAQVIIQEFTPLGFSQLGTVLAEILENHFSSDSKDRLEPLPDFSDGLLRKAAANYIWELLQRTKRKKNLN